MGLVFLVALYIGATGERAPQTETERVREIASGVRCPSCQGLSAAESDAIAAQAVRDAIRDRLRAGQSDAEIRAYLVSRFGDEILLTPRASGVAAAVWVLPVAVSVIAVAGVAAAFRRWRRERDTVPAPTDDDRAAVEDALRS
jgi:cytochrome c-type biogenesis protein CcmH